MLQRARNEPFVPFLSDKTSVALGHSVSRALVRVVVHGIALRRLMSFQVAAVGRRHRQVAVFSGRGRSDSVCELLSVQRFRFDIEGDVWGMQ